MNDGTAHKVLDGVIQTLVQLVARNSRTWLTSFVFCKYRTSIIYSLTDSITKLAQKKKQTNSRLAEKKLSLSFLIKKVMVLTSMGSNH